MKIVSLAPEVLLIYKTKSFKEVPTCISKKGDNVKVIAGKDKGKEGKVIATEPKRPCRCGKC